LGKFANPTYPVSLFLMILDSGDPNFCTSGDSGLPTGVSSMSRGMPRVVTPFDMPDI